MENRYYVGIDPGKSGAIAVIRPDRSVESWYMPVTVIRVKRALAKTKSGKPKVEQHTHHEPRQTLALLRMLKTEAAQRNCSLVVALETQSPRHTDGKRQVFETARGFGMLEMALAGLNMQVELVDPSIWRVKYVPKGANKKASLLVARRLFPQAALPLSKDEGRAEALLVADYLRRLENKLAFPKTTAHRRKNLG